MNTMELFSGTKSFSKVMAESGHNTVTIDNDAFLAPDICIDILEINLDEFPARDYEMVWASPPCTSFSVASIGRNWERVGNSGIPKTDGARNGIALVDKTMKILLKTRPRKWYIENPRGMLRVVIDDLFKKNGITDYVRHTVTYCQYGDTRMKPTDIWTNDRDWLPTKACKNGSPCHVSAPRGSRTGTQGLKNAKDRGVIPPALFVEILDADRGVTHENA